MIRSRDVDAVVCALRRRYAPLRAVALMARSIERALYAGRASDVVFWALVFARYRGGPLDDFAESRVLSFRRTLFQT